jgi:tetratricopeptide (TPR) repeat protein
MSPDRMDASESSGDRRLARFRGDGRSRCRLSLRATHWLRLPDSLQRCVPELWDSVRPLYDAGRYAEAADRGRELIEARPDQGYLYYNVACCESLAGRAADAIEHLRQAIDMWEGCRGMAKEDSDFDPIRNEPAFEELVGG